MPANHTSLKFTVPYYYSIVLDDLYQGHCCFFCMIVHLIGFAKINNVFTSCYSNGSVPAEFSFQIMMQLVFIL